MEMDFLGLGGTASGAKERRGGRVDAAFSFEQWPLSDKSSSMQQFKPFNTPKSALFDLISSNAFQPIGAFTTAKSTGCAAVRVPQISLGMDRQNVQQFAIHDYQNQDIDNCCDSVHLAPASPTSIPIGMSSPLLKMHGSSNVPNLTVTAEKPLPFRSSVANSNSLQGTGVGSFAPRNIRVTTPTTAQLTLFYAGSVNVYDDVPWDKARAVMVKASEGCEATPNVVHSIIEPPALHLTEGSLYDRPRVSETPKTINNHVVSSCWDLSSALSLTLRIGNQSESGSMTTKDRVEAKGIVTLVSAGQDETSMIMSNSIVAATATTKIMPRAVPQTRKASLARFLEKRKERMINTMPYSFDKKPSEIVPHVAVPISNCSVPQATPPSKEL